MLDHLDATAVSAAFVNRLIEPSSRSRRIVLLLDCCYGGRVRAGGRRLVRRGVELKEQLDGRGRVVLTASNSMEYAFEGDDARAATAPPRSSRRAIVEGLRTGAPIATATAAFPSTTSTTTSTSRCASATPNQTPSKWTFDVQGDLVVARSQAGPIERAAPSAPDVSAAVPATATRTKSLRDAALRVRNRLGPLPYSLVFAVIAVILFTTAPGGFRDWNGVAYDGSPLNRIGTLTIGAALAALAALTAIWPALRQGATTFIVALGLLELCGAAGTVALIRTDLLPSEPNYGVPLGWDSAVAAGLSMAVAAIAAAVTLHNTRRPVHLKRSSTAVLLTVVATATVFWSLTIAQYTSADRTNVRLGYEANAYHIEPVAIGLASAIGVLLAYRATASVAAGWLAAVATNTLLYVTGLALAVGDFTRLYPGLTVGWGCAVLYGTAALLGVATGVLVRVAHRSGGSWSVTTGRS